MEIRNITNYDAKEVRELFQIAFREDQYYKKSGVEDLKKELPTDFIIAINYAVSKGCALGMFERDKLVGFILAFNFHECKRECKFIFNEIFGITYDWTVVPHREGFIEPVLNLPDDACYILSVAVLEKYRRRGVASKLIDAVIEGTSCSYVVSDISETNSLPIYIKRGFTTQDIEEDYSLVILNKAQAEV